MPDNDAETLKALMLWAREQGFAFAKLRVGEVEAGIAAMWPREEEKKPETPAADDGKPSDEEKFLSSS